MKKLTVSALLGAAAILAASPAHAGSSDGKVQIKLLATGVLPDGKITALENNAIGLPAGSQTSANDNVVPTVAIEYFASDNVSIETICCLTQHKVGGEGAIAGTKILEHVLILPATVTLKDHLDAGLFLQVGSRVVIAGQPGDGFTVLDFFEQVGKSYFLARFAHGASFKLNALNPV